MVYKQEGPMAGAAFNLSLNRDIAVINITGSLDAHSTPEFDKTLKDAMAKTKKIAVDVSGMDYIATSGLGALMGAKSQGANIVIAGMNDSVKKVFSAMGFTNIFKIYPD